MTKPRMVFPLLAVLMAATASAQSNVVTITEPGVYELDELFKVADVVAVVKVLSGDTENYEKAVYKGEVVQGFKGMATGQTVYFGPFIGERLGWEYVLFLRKFAEARHSQNNSKRQLWNSSVLGGFRRRVLLNADFLCVRLRRKGNRPTM